MNVEQACRKWLIIAKVSSKHVTVKIPLRTHVIGCDDNIKIGF